MPMMTQAEYAAHRGVSRPAVCQAIKAGRITLVNGKVDRDAADASWSARSTVRARTPADTKGAPRNRPPPARPPSPPRDDDQPDYFIERARRERAEADIAEMKAAELAKDLVRVEDVRRQWERIAAQVKENVMQLPDRLAPLLEERPLAFIRSTLDAEFRRALQTMDVGA